MFTQNQPIKLIKFMIRFPTEKKLKEHIKSSHDPERAIICDKCGKQMRSQSILKKHHEVMHSDVPRPIPVPMQCQICGSWLRHAAGLRLHIKRIHEGAGVENRCHICNKTSTTARALKRHIYHNHECERKFKCTMCEKAFKRPQELREHTSTHTGEVLYTCPNCPMTFFCSANMYKHRQRRHRAEYERDRKKPRPPNIMQQAVGATAAIKMQQDVGASYPTEKELQRHIKSSHDPETAIICDKCGKQMRSQWILRKHHELMHSEVPRPLPVPMQCQICGSWLRHAAGLKVHIKRVHEEAGVENRCHICNKISTTARALKRHIYHNHECERKFKCSMCEKAFKRPQDLREHTSTHTGEVLYTCPNCPMTFFCKANMLKHRQRKHRADWERDRKKASLPNIMQQAVDATVELKMQQDVGNTSDFFENKT